MFNSILPILVDVGTGLAAIGAGIAIAFGAGFSGIGEGLICSKGVEGIARNPEAADKIRTAMILGCALDETTGIYSLLVAILIIFVMK